MLFDNLGKEYYEENIISTEIEESENAKNTDISDLLNIGYPIKVKLTLMDILAFCSTDVFMEILGLTNLTEESDSVEYKTAFHFNTSGNLEWEFKDAIIRNLAKLYKNKDNNEYEYEVVLFNLNSSIYESLPNKIKETLKGVEFIDTIPELDLPNLAVKKVNSIETKKFVEEGTSTFMNKEIKYKDNYLFCNLPVKYMDLILNTKGKMYYDAINKKFNFGLVDEDKFKLLLMDIAENGMREPFIMEVSGYGIIVDYLSGEHRRLAIKYLGLETIPACLIYRHNLSYPFPATVPPIKQKQNAEFISFLNENFKPDYIFRTVSEDSEIPYYETDKLYTDMQQFLNKARTEIINAFPDTLYTNIEDLPKKIKDRYPFSSNEYVESSVSYEN